MKNKYISLILFTITILPFCLFSNLTNESSRNSKIKVLVLIISSDGFDGIPVPFYAELEKSWRSYMHTNPEHIESYFIKADPDLPVPYKIDGDVIWSRTVENARPGILTKTILSIECLLPRIQEFDYILRTNLASFFVFDKLLNSLTPLPRSNCYFGSHPWFDHTFGSGSGYVVSTDLARLLVENKKQVLSIDTHDDMAIAQFLRSKNISLIPTTRIDIENMKEWLDCKQSLNPDVFHFRIKDPTDSLRQRKEVVEEELRVRNDMLNTFYDIPSTNDIENLKQTAKHKLGKIHGKMRLLRGNFKEEYPEQLMAAMYLDSDAKVLELGGNIGRNSCVIGSILNDSRNLVVIEPDKKSAEYLQRNRNHNNLHFHVETSAISKVPLVQLDWTSKPSDVDLPGFFRLDTTTFNEVQKKYNIEFDTMVVDCEGALYYMLRDDPEILKNIKLIIIENDYTNKNHLNYTLNMFRKNGFRLVFSDKHEDSPTSFREDFYQVWKK